MNASNYLPFYMFREPHSQEQSDPLSPTNCNCDHNRTTSLNIHLFRFSKVQETYSKGQKGTTSNLKRQVVYKIRVWNIRIPQHYSILKCIQYTDLRSGYHLTFLCFKIASGIPWSAPNSAWTVTIKKKITVEITCCDHSIERIVCPVHS